MMQTLGVQCKCNGSLSGSDRVPPICYGKKPIVVFIPSMIGGWLVLQFVIYDYVSWK